MLVFVRLRCKFSRIFPGDDFRRLLHHSIYCRLQFWTSFLISFRFPVASRDCLRSLFQQDHLRGILSRLRWTGFGLRANIVEKSQRPQRLRLLSCPVWVGQDSASELTLWRSTCCSEPCCTWLLHWSEIVLTLSFTSSQRSAASLSLLVLAVTLGNIGVLL